MLDLLTQPFMVRALLAALIAAVTSAVIGCFTVLRGLSTMGAATAHASLAGALIAFALGFNPLIGAALLSLLFALITAYSGEHERMDVVLGVSFGFSAALAALALAMTREYTVTAYTFLVGEVLGVTDDELAMLASMSFATLMMVFLFYKEFKYVTFDREAAEAMGLRADVYHYLMVVLIALTTVVELRVVGSILAVVLLVAPAAAAYEFSHSVERMIALAVAFSVASSTLGLAASVAFNTPTSPIIGVIASLIYLASLPFSQRRRCCAGVVRVFRAMRGGLRREEAP